MQRMRDGAGIYTLGPQPRSRVADNCVLGAIDPQRRSDLRHVYALYHDDGSAGFASERNTFSEGSSVLIKGATPSTTQACPRAAAPPTASSTPTTPSRRGAAGATRPCSRTRGCARKHGRGGFVQPRARMRGRGRAVGGHMRARPARHGAQARIPEMEGDRAAAAARRIEQALKDMHAIAYRDSRLSCDVRAGCRNHTDAACAAGGGRAGAAARRAGAARGKGRRTGGAGRAVAAVWRGGGGVVAGHASRGRTGKAGVRGYLQGQRGEVIKINSRKILLRLCRVDGVCAPLLRAVARDKHKSCLFRSATSHGHARARRISVPG